MAGQRCLCWDPDTGPCGDGHANLFERCDGDDLRGITCLDKGYLGGELRCTDNCELNESGCLNSICGDGVVQGDEVCDGDARLGESCWSLGYLGGGTLSCHIACQGYITVLCDQSQYCGNGAREGTEVCDGVDLGGETCVTRGYIGGELACQECLSLDESGCEGTPECGNGVAEGVEVCDGSDLRGTDCSGVGFTGGGVLRCQEHCQRWDVVSCRGGCGNDLLEGTETCDGTDFGGLACPDFGYPVGAVVCSLDCGEILVTGCGTWDATCGNGLIEPGEQCDGTSLGAHGDCVSQGFVGGSAACDPWCRLDSRGCVGDLCAMYGQYSDGLCDPCELWGGFPDPDCALLCPVSDGVCVSRRDHRLGVSTCQYATGAEDPDCGSCGDGVLQPGLESCDGTAYHVTCAYYGYQSGDPTACDDACVPDLSACIPHVCGDGVLCSEWQPSCQEECDDGNTVSGDGCDSTCHSEP